MASEVARLVGMELREYEKDGNKRQFCGLHLVHVDAVVNGQGHAGRVPVPVSHGIALASRQGGGG